MLLGSDLRYAIVSPAQLSEMGLTEKDVIGRPYRDIDPDPAHRAVLEQVYRTNVIAPLALIQALQGHIKSGAAILNITSDAGVEAYEGWGGYGSSKAALEQLSHILAAENPAWRVYWVDPGDMRTQMHQEAFPGEDISDRPLPEVSVPGLLALISGTHPSGRYSARALSPGEA